MSTGTARLVVLASGEGSILQALLAACARGTYGATVVAVGTDRPDCRAVERAEAAGVPTFAEPLRAYPDRASWDAAIAKHLAAHRPDYVVCAGFMRLLGEPVRAAHRIVNTHAALLPAFPGAHPVRDTLAYGVKVTGATVHFIDDGVDTGPIIAQQSVAVHDDDTEESLHERIKQVERTLLVDTVERLATQPWTLEGRTVVFR